ncbi:MAG: hypothetical protein IPQ09_21985 [Myxococcales bacterium]|nr:hypothetical protein [Myxococcales bacterium]
MVTSPEATTATGTSLSIFTSSPGRTVQSRTESTTQLHVGSKRPQAGSSLAPASDTSATVGGLSGSAGAATVKLKDPTRLASLP